MKSISAVLPAYNEEALIERTVRRTAAALCELCEDFEVIVTNDGSRDRTGEILARLQVEAPEVRLRGSAPRGARPARGST